MSPKRLANIDPGYGLLSTGAKPLPEPISKNHQWSDMPLAKCNFTRNSQDTYPWYDFEHYKFKITAVSHKVQWVNTRGGL